jgi:hypothetical protein
MGWLVMAEYAVAANTRVCAATARPLLPGEKYFGVLLDDAGTYRRHDYAADAWPGPPADCVAFWMGKVPPAGPAKKPPVNDEHLLGLLNQTADRPDRGVLRYAVALLLLRRKRLKFEDTARSTAGDILVLRDAKTGTKYTVPDPKPTDAEVEAVQQDVMKAMGWS